MKALLLSFIYVFDNYEILDNDIGAGDLASGPFKTGLTHSVRGFNYSNYYAAHALVTQMYNEMVNGSLPVSVLKFPSFFMPIEKKESCRWKTQQHL